MIENICNKDGNVIESLAAFDAACSNPVRQLDCIITYYNTDGELVTVSADDINSCEISYEGNLFSAIMKQCTIEVKGITSIPSNKLESVKLGIYVPSYLTYTIDDYYYIDYGAFYVDTSDSETGYKSETKTYKAICYDAMVNTMITLSDSTTVTTFAKLIAAIEEQTRMTITGLNEDLDFNFGSISEYESSTCRDMLNDIAGLYGGFFVIQDENIAFKQPPTLDDMGEYIVNYTCNSLNTLSVSNAQTMGHIDYIGSVDKYTFDFNSSGDTVSIENNVLVRYLVDQQDEFTLDLVFNNYVIGTSIDGLTLTQYELTTTRLTRLDVGDPFYITDVNNNTSQAYMFNQTITYSGGISISSSCTDTSFKAEYSYTTAEEKALNAATVAISRANGQLELKVSKDELFSSYTQDEKSINLTASNITITSDKFTVDEEGVITATEANISGAITGSTITGTEISGTQFILVNSDTANGRIIAESGGDEFAMGYNVYTDGEGYTIGSGNNGWYLGTIGSSNRLCLSERFNVEDDGSEATGVVTATIITGDTLISTDGDTSTYIGRISCTLHGDSSAQRRNYIGSTSGGFLVTAATGNSNLHLWAAKVRVNGTLTLSDPSVSSATALYVNSSGTVTTSSSSERYKENITETLPDDLNPDKLYELPIKAYNYKEEYKENELTAGTQIGIIAEDVDECYPNACTYNKDGEPESWQDRIMIPAMLKLIQEQKQKLDELEARIAQLEQGGTE